MTRFAALLLVGFLACDDETGITGADLGVDLSIACTLATLEGDCGRSCGVPDGGLPGTASPDWPCLPDPWCVGGRWMFSCVR